MQILKTTLKNVLDIINPIKIRAFGEDRLERKLEQLKGGECRKS